MTSRPASTAGRLALILAGALAGLGSVGAGALATLEYRAAAFAALPPAQQIDRLLQGEVPRAASLRARRGAMLACHDGLAGPQARYQPQEALDMIAATCE